MKYNLPKGYLSFSAINQFISSPAQFRKRYYECAPMIVTPELTFGKTTADKLEKKDKCFDHIKQYDTPEQKFNVKIEGIPLFGYIDSFDPDTNTFIEFKTGKVAWTQKRVDKHLQLPIYSVAIEELFGSVNDVCELIWMETRKTKEKLRGLVAHEDSHTIELTGRVETFTRTIDDQERAFTRQLIINTAKDISDDYTKWQEEQDTPRRGLT